MKKKFHQFEFRFDPIKDEYLIENRNISFDTVITLMENGDYLDLVEHPNQKLYKHQYVCVVEVGHYCYMVPFVYEGKTSIFLKTIIPSRKMTKRYLGGEIR